MKSAETKLAEALTELKKKLPSKYTVVLAELTWKRDFETKLHFVEQTLKNNGADVHYERASLQESQPSESGRPSFMELMTSLGLGGGDDAAREIQESRGRRSPKNNGAAGKLGFLQESAGGSYMTSEGLGEADPQDPKIKQTMREAKMNFREAAIFLGYPDPGKGADKFTESQVDLKSKWGRMRGLLSEAEINKLVEKGIRP